MRRRLFALALALALAGSASALSASNGNDFWEFLQSLQNLHNQKHDRSVQLGPRPFFLVNDMQDGWLKRELEKCEDGPFEKTSFSIGHRGAALQFPEHTREAYEAGARMGAGILECDVAFTKDKELVCRHSRADLHTTTNILLIPDLAAKCSVPFQPAVFNAAGDLVTPATALCRTTDITLAEFKDPRMRGKMDASNPRAKTALEYQGGTANFRTDLYAGPTSGHLLTHKESIQLFKKLGVKMTPELKESNIGLPYTGWGATFTQQDYARKMIDEYIAAGVSPHDVFPQSFNQPDILWWIQNRPAYGKQAVYLDDYDPSIGLLQPSAAELVGYKLQGINIVGPPIPELLTVDGSNRIVPSQYAKDARNAGLDIITWTLERSGILADGNNGFYFASFDSAISREGDTYKVLDVLARDVGIMGIFSDWAATVTYYANCMGLK